MSTTCQVHEGDADGRSEWEGWMCLRSIRKKIPHFHFIALVVQRKNCWACTSLLEFLIVSECYNSCECWGFFRRSFLYYVLKEFGDLVLFKFPTLTSAACPLVQGNSFSIPCQLLLPNHDHPVEKSMLNLVCKLRGRCRSVPPGAGGPRAWRSPLTLLGKAWVRLMKLDLTQSVLSRSVFLSVALLCTVLFFLFYVFLSLSSSFSFPIIHWGRHWFPPIVAPFLISLCEDHTKWWVRSFFHIQKKKSLFPPNNKH